MGKLYVVPTPVGNMEDMTFRAVRVLKEADFILAEDTRTSSVLLQHYDIHGELLSHHKFNEHDTVQNVVRRILGGMTAALISDAGTPAISDPGFLLVRECVKNGIEVQTLPGATAFVPALVSSGMPCDKFCFEGFLSTSKKSRKEHLESLQTEQRTMIFYEAPHKLITTLKAMLSVLGDRRVALVRELTKLHETVERTSLSSAVETALGRLLEYKKAENKTAGPILLLGRFGFDGDHLEKSGLFEYINRGDKIKSVKYPELDITFMTAHSSKGLGYDDVIIVNGKNETYGFPSKIEDDPVLAFVIKGDRSIDYAEERERAHPPGAQRAAPC